MIVQFFGGSGFIGTTTLDMLKRNHKCINIDKNVSFLHPELTLIADITNIKELEVLPIQKVDVTVLLAAEHRDDVNPVQLYYDVNVEGTRNVLAVMEQRGINKIVFTSSVAVYGLNKENPSEQHPVDPFNHYGRSKWQAEEVLREWYYKDPKNRSLTIIRPTVVFGERNRGNVYNLLKQVASGKFMMVGSGENKKSMAYVGNVAAFLKYCVETAKPGYRLYNYVDKPDLTMNQLVAQVEKSLNKKIASFRLPYTLGYLGGLSFDLLSKITGKKFPVSAVRVKKFCATTQFDATNAHASGFKSPFSLEQGLDNTLTYEFRTINKDQIIFDSE